MTFKSLFGQFTILSLNLVNFRVSSFPVSHLTHETVNLGLQNTLNMSKTTRVYFGALQSSSARKAHLRSIRSTEIAEVQAVSKLPRLYTSITFSNLDLEGCQHPHDDPLVVRTVVANKTVHRVLIYNGSSADIIFALAFDKMGIGREKLEPVSTHMRGLSGEKVLPLG